MMSYRNTKTSAIKLLKQLSDADTTAIDFTIKNTGWVLRLRWDGGTIYLEHFDSMNGCFAPFAQHDLLKFKFELDTVYLGMLVKVNKLAQAMIEDTRVDYANRLVVVG